MLRSNLSNVPREINEHCQSIHLLAESQDLAVQAKANKVSSQCVDNVRSMSYESSVTTGGKCSHWSAQRKHSMIDSDWKLFLI
jgi:hypothetical protein